MNTTVLPELYADAVVSIHPPGYIRHWLVTGLHETLYTGPKGEERDLRRDAVDQAPGEPPMDAVLHGTAPFGKKWRFHDTGENFFVEHSNFFSRLTLSDSYAFTWLEVEEDGAREVVFWVAGVADLWINGEHITRLDGSRYMYPEFKRVVLPLRRGINTVCVRLQCFGTRDTRILFGIQLAESSGLQVRIPGVASLVEAGEWLYDIRTEGDSVLVAHGGVPAGVEIVADGNSRAWSAGDSRFTLEGKPALLSVKINVDGTTLERLLEIPANYPQASHPPGADLKTIYLERTAEMMDSFTPPLSGMNCYLPLLAQRLLGRKSEKDGAPLAAVVSFINDRADCADFALSTLLRLESLGLSTPEESALIKKTALAFRYWSDEPGSDAMCYWSENHSLLFHGCQMIAGNLWPGEIFQCSGRTGREQEALGAKRCAEWLEHVGPRGLVEFNSSAYLPITIGALLNIVDFSAAPELSRRAAAIIDRIYEDLAGHCFRGVVITPQGRVYRNVLYPENSGSQVFMSYVTGDLSGAVPTGKDTWLGNWPGGWIVFPASSKKYVPPAGLDARGRGSISRRYQQAGVEIAVEKTPDWILTSLAIPAQDIPVEKQNWELTVGRGGYQQHVWQATLAPGCHVFVNHPGCSMDYERSRPGYWFGNGLLPCVRQRGNVLSAIYCIPDGTAPPAKRNFEQWSWPISLPVPFDMHPIPFTHAHWPADAFDERESLGNWVFGRKGGFVGLWCSEPLQPHDDMLTGRELRANAFRCGWVAVCGSAAEQGSFEAFIESCIARQPEFDRDALALSMNGEAPLKWETRLA